MNTWLTSDHHFSHRNVLEYCHRPFGDEQEMNFALVDHWNEVVKPSDVVYHLGDFTLGNFTMAQWHFSVLNGKIKVLGNYWHHDARWLNEGVCYTFSGQAVEILPPMVVLEDVAVNEQGRDVPLVLCHYPIAEWDRKHYGSYHCHGHSHGNYVYPPGTRALDVGVDVHNFYPISIQQAVEIMDNKVKETNK